MVYLLIIAAWLLLLSLVAGLCVAARDGDHRLQPDAAARAERPPAPREAPRPDGMIVAAPAERPWRPAPRLAP